MYPRYLRDQYQIIKEILEKYPKEAINHALDTCIKYELYSANDFKDVLLAYHAKQNEIVSVIPKPLSSTETQRKISLIKTEARNLETYTKMMEES